MGIDIFKDKDGNIIDMDSFMVDAVEIMEKINELLDLYGFKESALIQLGSRCSRERHMLLVDYPYGTLSLDVDADGFIRIDVDVPKEWRGANGE